MKRICSMLIVLAMVVSVQAQSVKLGLKGGVNNTEMKFDTSVFDSSNRFGWFAGPALKVSILGGLGFDIAALYDQRESKVSGETIKQKSVLVPLNARLNVGLGSAAGFYLAAGPQFGFNVGDEDFKWNRESAENTFQLKKSAFSVNLGAGIYLSKHFEVGFAYNIAMGSTADATFKSAVDAALEKNDDAKAKAWTISAAYYF